MCSLLREISVSPCEGAIPKSVADFVAEGLRRAKTIDCFDFVPSDGHCLFAVLDGSSRGRFCEWGSGIGIGIGMASMLGFQAHGIEIHAELAEASRQLLADFGLSATVETGSYFEIRHDADFYFNYSWPSQLVRVEEHFMTVAPRHARLLMCHGAEDIRCKTVVRTT